MKREGGYSVAEVMVAVAIFSFLSLTFHSVSSFAVRMKTEDRIQNELLNDARILMEKVIWGMGVPGEDERSGFAEAVTWDVNGNTVQYTLPDGVQRRIVQSQDELTYHSQGVQYDLYDPNGAAPPEPQKYDTQLTFVQVLPNVVEVQIVLGRNHAGRWYHATLASQVALRNVN
jgi:hypothetical protein